MNDELFTLLDIMKANNVDFDGIGIQSHYGSVVSPVKTYEFYDRLYKDYGKRLKITEYDFSTQDNNLQGSYTRDLLITAFSHEAVDGFIMWGFKGGSDNRYVFYDSEWNEKPGLSAWQDLIYNKWWTEEAGTTDANGTFATRGFYGDYDITVTANGKTKTVSVPCYKGNDNTIVITLD
jgi:GH35 family endo-1,4-beta-xylanase